MGTALDNIDDVMRSIAAASSDSLRFRFLPFAAVDKAETVLDRGVCCVARITIGSISSSSGSSILY